MTPSAVPDIGLSQSVQATITVTVKGQHTEHAAKEGKPCVSIHLGHVLTGVCTQESPGRRVKNLDSWLGSGKAEEAGFFISSWGF